MFRVARELGLPVSECLKRVSHREYLAWLNWFELDFNMPGKLEFYLMQIAFEVWKKDKSDFGNIGLSDFKIQIIKSEPDLRTPEEIYQQNLAASKASWMAIAGSNKKKKGTSDGNRQSNRPSNW